MEQIYRASGWPDSFNATKFERLRVEIEKAEETFRHQTDALEDLENLRVHQQRLSEWRIQIRVVENEINGLEIKLEQRLLPQSEIDKLRGKLDDSKRRLEDLHRYVDPLSPERWEQLQQRFREKLEHTKSERQLMIDRQGRFSGVTDEEYQKFMAEDYYNSEVQRLEADLADVDEKARNNRIERETRRKAEAVDEALRERWLAEQTKWGGKDDEWVKEWTEWFEAKRDLS